jgi:hypothetical protein
MASELGGTMHDEGKERGKRIEELEHLASLRSKEMGEEFTAAINDTNRAIRDAIEHLRKFDSPRLDPRVKAIIITHLEEAQLWSLKLIKDAFGTSRTEIL